MAESHSPLRVCVVGSGAREHALAESLSKNASVLVTPGNPLLERPSVRSGGAGDVLCRDLDPASVEADLWVIGPEAPLVAGLADNLRARGKAVFGPGADGARLEGSKAWMKEVLTAAGVPTAAYGVFDSPGRAIEFLRSLKAPWVIKTDGLAAGKGVLVTADLDHAEADVVAKLSGRAFGEAGKRVVIEEGLEGRELSLMAVCDGVRAWPLAPASDFKRLCEADSGPNTGGMGAYSPLPYVDPATVDRVMKEAVEPTLAELRERGIDYRGVLYAGVMLTAQGPKVLEFNVRFGDPEAEVVLPRWCGDVTGVLAAAAAGHLDAVGLPEMSPHAAVCVVLAASGYPERPRSGDVIIGIERVKEMHDVRLYGAGVTRSSSPPGTEGNAQHGHSCYRTAGGRVLVVTGLGSDLGAARQRAYEAVSEISWPGMVHRRDIASPESLATLPTGGMPTEWRQRP